MSASPEEILQQYWQYPAFRSGQREIIDSILQQKDTLALMPTGGGKSICYQVPAMLLPGVCLVISPLVALMQDQVLRLQELGIPATAVFAGMHTGTIQKIWDEVRAGVYKLLYLSPERLQSRSFLEVLPSFPLSFIAVDEAHCISHWGHDFRPDYQKISIVKKYFPEIPILALTATATPQVQADMVRQLGMKQPQEFRLSFQRPNLSYQIQYSEQKLTDTISWIRDVKEQTCIVYCRSRRQTEQVAQFLNDQGIVASHYHAGMDFASRKKAFEDWKENRSRIMVATTAFGMGIDKPDVRLVLHYDMPEHLEAYYQEAGRAGRDGLPAQAVLLYNHADIKQRKQDILIQYPKEDFLRNVYQAVCEYLQLPIGVEPGKYYPFSLQELCHHFKLPLRATSYALRILEQEGLWTLSEGVWLSDTLHISIAREEVDLLSQHSPQAYEVLIAALRLYGTLFIGPTPIDLRLIARKSERQQSEVRKVLLALQQAGILSFQESGETPKLYFHHRRTDHRHLLLHTDRILSLRRQMEARVQAMIEFVTENNLCREQILLHYFDEHVMESCGRCDVCMQQQPIQVYPQAQMRDIIWQTLSEKSIDTEAITQLFPKTQRTEVLNCLREMREEAKVGKDAYGKWYCLK